jgi:hypothetical protein
MLNIYSDKMLQALIPFVNKDKVAKQVLLGVCVRTPELVYRLAVICMEIENDI